MKTKRYIKPFFTKQASLMLFIVCLFNIKWSQAQQEAQYTQYMYNTEVINPAYAGSRGVLSIFGTYRAQWIGLEGAPRTLNFSVNAPVAIRTGLGLTAMKDEIGPTSESLIAIDYSHTLPLENKAKLSFGLKAGLQFLSLDYSKLNPEEINDPNITGIDSKMSPVVGLGFYLHSKKWYAGISSPNILSTRHFDDIAVSTASEKAHIYLMGGYVFDLNEDIKFKPAMLVKAAAGSPVAMDISASILMNKKFMMGASYRWNTAISAMAGFQLSDSLYIGYSYDIDTTELRNYNSGSHELFLRFEWVTKKKNKIDPRFF